MTYNFISLFTDCVWKCCFPWVNTTRIFRWITFGLTQCLSNVLPPSVLWLTRHLVMELKVSKRYKIQNATRDSDWITFRSTLFFVKVLTFVWLATLLLLIELKFRNVRAFLKTSRSPFFSLENKKVVAHKFHVTIPDCKTKRFLTHHSMQTRYFTEKSSFHAVVQPREIVSETIYFHLQFHFEWSTSASTKIVFSVEFFCSPSDVVFVYNLILPS